MKAADETEHGITIDGQENDVATRALAKMNMILHNHPTADIRRENTISAPQFKERDGSLKRFDFAVANPPFSNKNWQNGIDPQNDEYKRFDGFGIPPAKNGDYVFLLHLIKSLKSTGKSAIILPHGVLFRGGGEAEIRENIIKRGYIKGIIGLPSNLFYGTGIPACIIVVDKENAEVRKGIFVIDASKGYSKDGNKNRLRDQDIHKIVDVFSKQTDIPKYSRMVSISEISNPKNNYNLNIPRYIDSQEEEDLQDIEAHLRGGIPNKDVQDLKAYWNICPDLKNTLFSTGKRAGYFDLKIQHQDIKATIFSHPEFSSYSKRVVKLFDEWSENSKKILKKIRLGDKPKEIITQISEALLTTFSKSDLIDKYDIYQNLMTYWSEIMQDDIYLIAVNGWKAELSAIKNKKDKEIGWDCELVPKSIIIMKYFSKEQDLLDKLESEISQILERMQTLDEENSGEEDMFSEVRNESGKISKTDVSKRINKIRNNKDFFDELKVLQEYLDLSEKESNIKIKIKDAQKNLDRILLEKYKHLSEDEIKTLVVEDKWMTALRDSINSEIESVSHKLAGRIKELAERYETPLPQLTSHVDKLSDTVNQHLKEMGFKW